MPEWKKKCRVRWDAAEGCLEGAGRAVHEALLDMKIYSYNVEKMDEGVFTLVTTLKVVWSWAMHFGTPQRILCGHLSLADPLLTNYEGVSSRLQVVGAIVEECDTACDGRCTRCVPAVEVKSVC